MVILDKKEIDNMKLFYEYIDKSACPTSYAVASGTLSFIDSNKILRCNYFVNDSSELNYSHVLAVNYEGRYKFISKLDKFFPGIRVALYEDELDKDLIYDRMLINKDLSVIEYGYFPKSRLDFTYTKVNTNTSIKLPVSKYEYTKSEYKDFTVYKDEIKNYYYIIYPTQGMYRVENKDFLPGELGIYKIEPIRFWHDIKSKILISQDVIMGGIAYKLKDCEKFNYDDYYESDVYESMSVIENDLYILDELINKDKKKVKRK